MGCGWGAGMWRVGAGARKLPLWALAPVSDRKEGTMQVRRAAQVGFAALIDRSDPDLELRSLVKRGGWCSPAVSVRYWWWIQLQLRSGHRSALARGAHARRAKSNRACGAGEAELLPARTRRPEAASPHHRGGARGKVALSQALSTASSRSLR
jgi:hypothetical protein